MFGGAAGLTHLARHQLGERLGDDPYRVRAEPGDEPRGRREQIVARQDRDVVAPPGVRAGCTAPHLGLVHHVVVVQRRQVHQLDDGARDGDLPVVGIGTQLRGQHGEQRAEPLTACLEQVLHGLGHQLVGFAQLSGHQVLDAGHAFADFLREGGVPEVHARDHARRCPHPANILGSMNTRADVVVVGAGPAGLGRGRVGVPAAAATCW